MVTQELLQYIREQLKSGNDRNYIENTLFVNGWDKAVIAEAFQSLDGEQQRVDQEMNQAALNRIQQPMEVHVSEKQNESKGNLSAQEQKFSTQELPEIGEMFKRTFIQFKMQWGKLTVLQAAPTVIMTAINVVLGQPAIFTQIVSDSTSFGVLISLAGGLTLLGAFLTLLFQITTIATIVKKDEVLSFSDAIILGLKNFFPLVFVNILIGLAVSGGFALFIVPGVLCAIWFSMTTLVILDQEVKGTKALLISKSLTQKHFWKLFIYALVGGISLGFIGSAINFTLEITGDVSSNFEWLKYIFFFIETAVNILLAIFTYIFSYQVYAELKNRQPAEIDEKKTKIMTWGLGCFGCFLPIIVTIIAITIAGTLFASLFGIANQNDFQSLLDPEMWKTYTEDEIDEEEQSPSNTESTAYDLIRQDDISNIQDALDTYYSKNNEYPNSLAILVNILDEIPKDPETDTYYIYSRLSGGIDYEICATYSTGKECEQSGKYPEGFRLTVFGGYYISLPPVLNYTGPDNNELTLTDDTEEFTVSVIYDQTQGIVPPTYELESSLQKLSTYSEEKVVYSEIDEINDVPVFKHKYSFTGNTEEEINHLTYIYFGEEKDLRFDILIPEENENLSDIYDMLDTVREIDNT